MTQISIAANYINSYVIEPYITLCKQQFPARTVSNVCVYYIYAIKHNAVELQASGIQSRQHYQHQFELSINKFMRIYVVPKKYFMKPISRLMLIMKLFDTVVLETKYHNYTCVMNAFSSIHFENLVSYAATLRMYVVYCAADAINVAVEVNAATIDHAADHMGENSGITYANIVTRSSVLRQLYGYPQQTLPQQTLPQLAETVHINASALKNDAQIFAELTHTRDLLNVINGELNARIKSMRSFIILATIRKDNICYGMFPADMLKKIREYVLYCE